VEWALSILSGVERVAFSIRGIARRYGVGRGTVADAIQKGELPAAQLGPRHTVVLVNDFERWLRGHAVRPSAHASARVDAVLAREEHAA